MNQDNILMLSQQWHKICEQYTLFDLEQALSFIQEHTSILATEFYRQIMHEKEALYFLSDELVQTRLILSLQQWLVESFETPFKKNFQQSVEKQLKVGEVHARIGVPTWLIIRGIREIQYKIFDLLFRSASSKNDLPQANYISQILNFAIQIMSRSYEDKVEITNDVKHTYRLFSAMQDVTIQKDRQRGCLIDWENELIFKIFSNQLDKQHILLSKSEFGLWFIHKAAYAFTGTEQVNEVIQRIHSVDELTEQILQYDQKEQQLQFIQQIRNINREIQFLLDQLFQVAEYIDSGNDPLTQLLNRRYLSTIIAREVSYSRKNNTPLSLLAIDADHFKRINDKFGHSAGDLALQAIAEILLDSIKGSDYAFRVGGEEFLILLVDSTLARAKEVAEQIRLRIQETPIRTSLGNSFYFTVSIGCALYDGHPDYQRFLDTADSALYSAKNNGRNNVHIQVS